MAGRSLHFQEGAAIGFCVGLQIHWICLFGAPLGRIQLADLLVEAKTTAERLARASASMTFSPTLTTFTQILKLLTPKIRRDVVSQNLEVSVYTYYNQHPLWKGCNSLV